MGFLYERGLDVDENGEENVDSTGPKMKIFEDMASADAFFARVLFEANRENPTASTGLKFVCVELGSRIDDTSEFHAIHAFVRRCVGTYEGASSSDEEEEEENIEDEENMG